MKYPEVEISKDDLRKIIYFILMKFRADPGHRQGTSAKRDLIGGYIERWFNKIAETVIFDELLKGKSYRALSDYFIYSNDSEKNAPDILGIESDRVFPFVRYNNGSWETAPGMPRIEVKTVRKDQALVGVRETQMIDDYYAFIESDLDGDYLTTIFQSEAFDEKYFRELKMSPEFIESDSDHQIIEQVRVLPADKIGTMRLIGIYTQENLRENSVYCASGVSPYYFGTAVNKSPASKLKLNEKVILDVLGRFAYDYSGSHVYLPVSIDNPKNAKIVILKKNKGSVYLNSTEDISIGGINLNRGDICLEYRSFDRSSKWDENIMLKHTLEKYGKDSTDKLIQRFDEIVSS